MARTPVEARQRSQWAAAAAVGIAAGTGVGSRASREHQSGKAVAVEAAAAAGQGIQCIVAGEAAAAAVPGLALESQYTVAAKELVRSLWVEAQRDWVVDQAAGQHPYYQTILRHTAAAAAGHQVVGCYRLGRRSSWSTLWLIPVPTTTYKIWFGCRGGAKFGGLRGTKRQSLERGSSRNRS